MPRFPSPAPSTAAMKGSVYSGLAGRLASYSGEKYPLHVGDTWKEPAEGCRMEDLKTAEHPGMHRYTPSVQGLPRLLDLLVARERERTGVDVTRENVVVVGGATVGLANVLGAIAEPGDEVLLLAPYWPLIEGIVRTARATPVAVPFLAGAEGAAAVDSPEAAVAAVERARTPRTAALYLNSPNNPTGRLIPKAWIEALVAWAKAHDLWVISDEVYDDYVFSGTHTPVLPLAPERTFVARSFSKSFGVTGNRCGWVVGPKAVMGELLKVHTHTTYNATTASQEAGIRLLSGPGDAWAAAARAEYRETGAAAARRLGVPAPEGSTFLFLDVATALDGRGLMGLLEDCVSEGLLVAPGPSFGPYPTHVRVCYTAAPPDVALRGVEVLARRLGR